jgi:hypothetical protein
MGYEQPPTHLTTTTETCPWTSETTPWTTETNNTRTTRRVGGLLVHSAATWRQSNNSNIRDQPKAAKRANTNTNTNNDNNNMDMEFDVESDHAVDSFLAFSRPLVQSMPENAAHTNTNANTNAATDSDADSADSFGNMNTNNTITECWMHEILHWHIRQVAGASTNNSRARKGRASKLKRPRAVAAVTTVESSNGTSTDGTAAASAAAAQEAADALPACVLSARQQQQQNQQQQQQRPSKKRALDRNHVHQKTRDTESDAHLLSYLLSQQQQQQATAATAGNNMDSDHKNHNTAKHARGQAEWKLLVELQAGQAAKSQRKRQRQLYKDRFQLPSMQVSDSWRQAVNRHLPPMVGDYRDQTVVATAAAAAAAAANIQIRYSLLPSAAASDSNNNNSSNNTATTSSASANHGYGTRRNSSSVSEKSTVSASTVSSSSVASTPIPTLEDYQGVWKAVLACAQVMGRHLQEEKPILLSSVVSFVGHAYQLPVPEVVFDSTPVVASHMTEEVSACMWTLLHAADTARKYQAALLDLWSQDGVDMDAARKMLEAAAKATCVRLDEAAEMQRQVNVVSEWTVRLETFLASAAASDGNNSNHNSSSNDQDESSSSSSRNGLEQLEAMAAEAKTHGFRCKGLVELESKIQKAHQLRDRILEWKKSCEEGSKETIKFVAAMVRDIQRLKLTYPVVTELLSFHRTAESWVDRANIAIRSKISLQEIKLLIARGEEMPLDLSEYLDKLRSRECLAEDWLGRFQEVVPRPTGGAEGESLNMLELMKGMRVQLDDTDARISLHDLVSEGSRIPVEVDCVKLLQVELDARNWMAKAKQWIPSTNEGTDDNSGKRGRLDDLRDHVEKASALRDKLILSSDEKKAWVLDGETELGSIVDAADEWFSKYEEFLDGDNRRNSTRCCVSIEKLREIVAEGNAIYANMGSTTSKMSKILVQAESWYEDHHPLLVRCGLRGTKSSESRVKVAELTKAVEAAASEVSLDLDEAMEVVSLVEKIQLWLDQASFVSGSKRQRRGKKLTFAVDDLCKLIDEASQLPIETDEYVKELNDQAQSVQAWQAQASSDLERILLGFQQLQEAITDTYGLPAEFSRDRSKDSSEQESDQPGAPTPKTSHVPPGNDEMDFVEEKKAAEDMSHCETMSTASEHELSSLSFLGSGDCNVHVLIRAFCKEAKNSCIVTPEGEAAAQLEIVSRWCIRSLKYLDNQKDVFDKRFFGAFDRFLSEGKELLNVVSGVSGDSSNEHDLLHRLSSGWGTAVADQMERLEVLLSERGRFVAWCDSAAQILSSDDRRPSIEKLKELSEKSNDFPGVSNLVQKVRKLATATSEWVKSTCIILDSEEKVAMHEAKAILDEGAKLGFQCNELRTLRNGLKIARGWANKVKRSKVDQGATHVSGVKALIEEHDSLIVYMPEELAKLQQAMKNYCICRRPYEGFMIGCDDCDEWFHGACIGVSETRADRVDKYVCIRCSVARVFKNSASNVAGVIRKYCSGKDLRKTRQIEAQKHQRKVRKETKDIGKLREEMTAIEGQLNRLRILSGASEDAPTSNGLLCNPVGPAGEGTNSDIRLQVSSEPTDVATTEISPQPEEEPARNDSTAAEGDPVESVYVGDEPVQAQDLEELESKLQKAGDEISKCESRLSSLVEVAAERVKQNDVEDSNMIGLRTWCIRVRSLVLVPSSDELARRSRPNTDGSLSGPMISLIDEAEKFGLKGFEDVSVIVNSFKCFSWSNRAMLILARQPSIPEIEFLVHEASSIDLPDEKAVRMLKVMANRAVSWQSKVSKLLAPVPGEKRPFNVDALKDLASAGEDIPLCLPFSSRILTVIEDKGARHCLCGGPSDGRFMLSCDQCDEWFHGHCVAVSKEISEEIEDWKCPSCTGSDLSTNSLVLDNFHDRFDVETEEDEEDKSSQAPDPERMWPPFGLFGSEKANGALGDECCAIPDDTYVHSVELHGHSEPATSTSAATHTTTGVGQGVAGDLVAGLSMLPLIATSAVPQIAFSSFHQGLTTFNGAGFSSLNGYRFPSTDGNTTKEIGLSAPATSNVNISFGTSEKSVVTEHPVKTDINAYGTQVVGYAGFDNPFTTSILLAKETAAGDTLMQDAGNLRQKTPDPSTAPEAGATEADTKTTLSAPEKGFMAPTVQEISAPEKGFMAPTVQEVSAPEQGFMAPTVQEISAPEQGFILIAPMKDSGYD